MEDIVLSMQEQAVAAQSARILTWCLVFIFALLALIAYILKFKCSIYVRRRVDVRK